MCAFIPAHSFLISMQTNTMQNQAVRLSIGKSSEYLEVSIDTLRRWEKKGVITAYRSPGGHRYFLRRDLDKLFGQKYTRALPSEPREIKIEPKPEEPRTISQDISTEAPAPVKSIQEGPPPSPSEQVSVPQTQEPAPQPKPERNIPWSKILIIGIILFVIADLILLAVYLTSSRPLVSPIP